MSNGPWNGPNPGQPGSQGWQPPSGGPQGYPNQGPPPGQQPGWGQPPYQGQGQPPYRPPYQGQPPQGQPPYPGAPGQPQGAPGPRLQPAPGYASPGGGAGRPPYAPPAAGPGSKPPRGTSLPLIVGLGVVALALIAGLVWWFTRPATVASPAPTTRTSVAVATPPPATTAPATSVATAKPPATSTAAPTAPARTTAAATRAPAAGEAPNMPAEVGGLKPMGTATNTLTIYSDAAFQKVVLALHLPGMTMAQAQASIANPTTVGAWTCGKDADVKDPVCVAASPYNGVLMVSGADMTAQQLATWGGELLTKWK